MLVETVTQPTTDDILQQDANVQVPVGPGLFMVEAHGMEQLVLDDLLENTALTTQRHCLATTTTPDKGETAGRETDIKLSSQCSTAP